MPAKLSFEEAIQFLAGDDKRPMLVLRECKVCNGTDDMLLSPGLDNTRTLIMTRWFNCVKLPMHVLEDDNAFHCFFEGEVAPHLFVCRYDGTGMKPLGGDTDVKELWTLMEELLTTEYKLDWEKSVKKLGPLMDEYDLLDMEMLQVQGMVEGELEKNGPKSKQLKKLNKQFDKLKDQMEDLKEEEAKLSELKLKYLQKGYDPKKDKYRKDELKSKS